MKRQRKNVMNRGKTCQEKNCIKGARVKGGEKVQKKYKMKFRSKGDYLMFIWILTLASIVGFGVTLGTENINWLAFLYFNIGLFSSLVLVFWAKRNKDMWLDNQIKCPKCKSIDINKDGFYYGKEKTTRKYRCKVCGRGFRV